MDRTNKRLSLSTSNLLSPPIAESTHVSQQKFPWGSGLNKSPVNYMKNNLSRNFNNKNNEQKSSINHNSIRNFNNTIDPKVYTDAQSLGFASRIVKYHNNNSKINRSASMTNLYNKPGQFPVVHLKKTKLPVKLNRNQSNVSIIKIAPPLRSIFQANSRATILRSCSTVGILEKSKELSHDDRPILHPNETEQNGTPTRSVLEVLKEISRKRINSDELDVSTDNIKKYCRESNIALDKYQYNHDIDNNIQENIRNKRQREVSYSPNNLNNNLNNSPEQLSSKRRLYSCSNDISSSLSSSLSMITPKRKLLSDEDKCGRLDQKTKNQKQMNDTNQLICSDKSNKVKNKISSVDEYDGRKNFNVSFDSTKTIPIPVRNIVSEPTIRTSEPVKPKLTLFNKNYSTDCISVIQDDFDDENAIVCFVKPKKSTLKLSRNSLIEKAQKSKLALMLSSLRGDLHEEDEIDSAEHKINRTIETKMGIQSSKEKCIEPQTNISNSTANSATKTIKKPIKKLNSQNQSLITKTDQIASKSISILPTVTGNNHKKEEKLSNKSTKISGKVELNTSKSIPSVIKIKDLPTNAKLDSTISTNSVKTAQSNKNPNMTLPVSTSSISATSIFTSNFSTSTTSSIGFTTTSNTEAPVLKELFKMPSSNETPQTMAIANSAFTTVNSTSITNSPEFTITANKNINEKFTGIGQNSLPFSFAKEPSIRQSENNNVSKSNTDTQVNNNTSIVNSQKTVPSNVNISCKQPEFNHENKGNIGGFNFGLESSKFPSFENNTFNKTSSIINNGSNESAKSPIFLPATVPLTTSSFGTTNSATPALFMESNIPATESKNVKSLINTTVQSNDMKNNQTNIKNGGFSFSNDKTSIFGNNNIGECVVCNEPPTKNTLFPFGTILQSSKTFNAAIHQLSRTSSIFGSKTNQSNINEIKPNTFGIDGNTDGKSLFAIQYERSNISEATNKANDITFGEVSKNNNNAVFGNASNFAFTSTNENAFGSFGSNNTKPFSFAENVQNKEINQKAFNFGTTSNNPSTSDKLFGFDTEKQTETFKFGENKSTTAFAEKSFAFGDNNKLSNSAGGNSFIFGEKMATPSFPFSGNTTAAIQPASSFTKTGNTNQEKPFNFGASANQSFTFGGVSNTNNKIQQSTGFNFVPPANTTAMTNNNLFNPGPPAERVIRKATRRLK